MTARANLIAPVGQRVALGLTAASTLFLLWLVYRSTVPMPFNDEFLFWPLFDAALRGQLATLEILRPFNGHPYPILKLLMWWVVRLQLCWAVLFWLCALLYGLAAWLAWRLCTRTLGAGSAAGVLAGWAAILMVATPRNWENLYWGMQVAFPLWLCALLASVGALQRYASDRREVDAWVCAGTAGFGLFCFGAGIVSFAVVLGWLSALWRGRQRGIGLAILALGIGLFEALRHLAPIPEPGLAALLAGSLDDPSRYLRHLWIMLGNSAITPDAPWRRIVNLAVGALLVLVALATAWRRLRSVPVAGAALLAVGVLIAVLTTLARLGIHVDQPDAPRYVTLAIPALLGAAMVALHWAARLPGPVAAAGAALVLAGSVFLWGVAANDELAAAPYRHRTYASGLQQLCAGSVQGLFRRDPALTSLPTMQAVFCRDPGLRPDDPR